MMSGFPLFEDFGLIGFCRIVVVLSAAPLVICAIIGLTVGVLQAATQIHEQTLTFVPKVCAVAVLVYGAGPWALEKLCGFCISMLRLAADV